MKRIPKSARLFVSLALSKLLDAYIEANDVAQWTKLLLFPLYVMCLPEIRSQRNVSLTTWVKKNLDLYDRELLQTKCVVKGFANVFHGKPDKKLALGIANKIDEGDFGGAMGLLSSDDAVANPSAETILCMEQKHPSAPTDLIFPLGPGAVPVLANFLEFRQQKFWKLLHLSQVGSAGGMHGVRL